MDFATQAVNYGNQAVAKYAGTPGLADAPYDLLQDENSLANSVTGAVVGGIVAGPIGALIGGTIGNSLPSKDSQGNRSISSNSLSSYFFRGVIIILGFIFVAIGLSMFKTPVIVEQVKKVIKK